MSPLLVENLMLITAHPVRGALRRPHGLALPRALAGAVLLDCLTLGAARLEEGRLLSATSPVRPSPVVEHVLDRLTRPTGVERAIESLAAPRTRLGQHLLASMAADGSVVRTERRLLGALPLTTHRVADVGAVETLRARVVAALLGPVNDAHVTTLAHLVMAGDLHRLIHIDTETVRRRGRPVLMEDPIATAVAETIRRARRDAATGGAIAATAAAVAGSGS